MRMATRFGRWAGRGLVPFSLTVMASQAMALGASASIDWSGLSVSVQDTAPDDGIAAGFTFGGQTTAAFQCPSMGVCTPLNDTVFDWTSSGSADAAGEGHAGRVTWSQALLAATISGNVADDDVQLTVFRSAYFSFVGAAEVTIRLPYTVTIDASGTDAVNGSFASASLGFGDQWANWYISSPWDGTTSYSGVLTATLRGEDGFSGYFNGTASALLDRNPVLPPGGVATPVPEPATLAMALGGLGLVAGATRRRRRAG